MKIIQLLPVIFLSFVACSRPDKYSEARKIYEESTIIHDELMPRLGEIMSLKHALKNKADSVNDPDLKNQFEGTIQSLDSTYNNMMDWMAQIQPVPVRKHETEIEKTNITTDKIPDPDQMLKIQRESLLKIKQIKSEFDKNLDRGNDLLRKI